MTGWRLFADTRHQYSVSWNAEAEYADGTTNELQLHSAGASDTQFLTGRLGELPINSRNHLCKTWLELPNPRGQVRRILIYRSTRDLGDRTGNRSNPPRQELGYICQDNELSIAMT